MLKTISWILALVVVFIGVVAAVSLFPRAPSAPAPQPQSSTAVQTPATTSTQSQPQAQPPSASGGLYNQVTIKAGNATVVADVADTDILRQQGLSGRASLPDGTGMWFVFDTDGEDGFWMKDMQFSIDMVWVNSDYTVVTVKADVSPDTYFDENPPEVFYPTANARYVLELPAGYAAAHGIAVGTQVVVQ